MLAGGVPSPTINLVSETSFNTEKTLNLSLMWPSFSLTVKHLLKFNSTDRKLI